MGKVVAKRSHWAQLQLNNGDRIMISIAQSGVKVARLKWAGIMPAGTLWESKSTAQLVKMFYDEALATENFVQDKPLNLSLS